MRKVIKLALFGVSLFIGGLVLLVLAGLFPQNRVQANVRKSLAEISPNFISSTVYQNTKWNRLDYITDCYMLNLSQYMDSRADVTSVLSNPIYWGDSLNQLEELTKAANGAPANGTYSNYLMGYRAWLRPLLTVMTYEQVRSFLALLLAVLFLIVVLRVQTTTKDTCFTAGFGLSVLLLNPFTIAGSLTYMTCFFLAFCGMLMMPNRIRDHSEKASFRMDALFLGLGIVTQYFDFLTYPLLTCAFPLIFRIKLHLDQKDFPKPVMATAVAFQSILLWLTGYVLTWMCKMLLASLLTEVNGADFMLRIIEGIVVPSFSTPKAFLYEYVKTIYYAVLQVFTPGAIWVVAAVFVFWFIRFCMTQDKNKHCKESAVFLFLALLGIIWLAVSNRTLYHVHFQYRSLGITLFGSLAFLSQTIRKPSSL